jgi:hypothetical protein
MPAVESPLEFSFDGLFLVNALFKAGFLFYPATDSKESAEISREKVYVT